MGDLRRPEVGKYYKHGNSKYVYIVTEVSDTHYKFTYFPDSYGGDWTFPIGDFCETELTELEVSLL